MGTSKPRAATSEATKNLKVPDLNLSSVSIRLDCSKSPCIGAASKPYFFIDFATTSTSVFLLQKIIALVQFSASSSIMLRNNLRFSVPSKVFLLALNISTDWVIVSEVLAARATSIFAGAERNVFVIRSISGAIVALKNSVCLVKGVRLNIFSISGMKPMSNIRSASSTTII